jgi:RHS repeat-associated protein
LHLDRRQGAGHLQTLGDLNYGYDADDRRTAMWSTAGGFARTGLPAAFGSSVYNANNELTSRGSASYNYAATGDLVGDGNVGYTWNARGQLVSQVPGRNKPGATASYAYDPFGRRLSKTINSTTTGFLFDGPNVVQEQGATQANLLTGLGVDQTFERVAGGTISDFETDALGSTLALTDGTLASVQTSYTYDSFGVVTSTGGGSTNPFQFTGREADGATGLQFNRARYYSPGLERWISEDPIGFAGGDVNLYGYVGGNPVASKDPLGLCPWVGRCGLDYLGPAYTFLATTAAGFGDKATFGGTDALRDRLGWNKGLDKCSLTYAVGGVLGAMDVGAISGAGAIGGLKLLVKLAPETSILRTSDVIRYSVPTFTGAGVGGAAQTFTEQGGQVTAGELASGAGWGMAGAGVTEFFWRPWWTTSVTEDAVVGTESATAGALISGAGEDGASSGGC